MEKLNIKFIKTKKIKKPYIILKNKKKISIFNLHIHSKNLSCFMSNNKNTNSYLLHPMM